MSTSLDIIGIGNAIVDVLAQSSDAFITENHLNKGAMTLIEADQAEALYNKMGPAVEVSGGSAANTVAAFAALGGQCGFIGKVADDQLGKVFKHDIQAVGATFKTAPLTDGPPTARCLIMVTPDAERTMCTFLGASVWITPGDIDPDFIQSAQIVYLEGYLFDRPKAKQAFLKASELAHEAGRKVSLSLSDPFCVDRHRLEFRDLVENHVDILFANNDEVMSLFEVKTLDEALNLIQGKCEIAVITKSSEGSIIITQDERIELPAQKVDRIIDTTGAGDLYAAGFLYGYTQGHALKTCGEYALALAAEVIQQMGARPQRDLSQVIQNIPTDNKDS